MSEFKHKEFMQAVIDEMARRSVSLYVLHQETDMRYSTLHAMFGRMRCPQIDTMLRLADWACLAPHAFIRSKQPTSQQPINGEST